MKIELKIVAYRKRLGGSFPTDWDCSCIGIDPDYNTIPPEAEHIFLSSGLMLFGYMIKQVKNAHRK